MWSIGGLAGQLLCRARSRRSRVVASYQRRRAWAITAAVDWRGWPCRSSRGGGGITREKALEAAAAYVPRGRFGTAAEGRRRGGLPAARSVGNVVGAAWSADGGTVNIII